MERVGVVILNYKLADLTLACIKSVTKSTYKNLEIFVVDNNSQDGLGEKLAGEKKVIFIQTGINKGYSGGNNEGIKSALKAGCDFIFIINPDTTIDEKAIETLIEKSKEYSADIVCPKIYFGDKKTIWYAGGIFDKANVLGSHRGVDEIDKGQYDNDQETEIFTGAAVLIRREVFNRVGLFDERFFLYYEDTDFSLRAKKAHFKIMYIPKAIVYHKNAQVTGLGSPLQDYYITRNRMLLGSKFLPLRTRIALFREALRNLNNPIRRKAFFDFLMNNFGKGDIR